MDAMNWRMEITEEERQRQEYQARLRREHLQDLVKVLTMPEGQRVMVRLLRQLGLAAPIGATDLSMRNFGILVLRDVMEAVPYSGMNILDELFGGPRLAGLGGRHGLGEPGCPGNAHDCMEKDGDA